LLGAQLTERRSVGEDTPGGGSFHTWRPGLTLSYAHSTYSLAYSPDRGRARHREPRWLGPELSLDDARRLPRRGFSGLYEPPVF